jgi:hypothetical protein
MRKICLFISLVFAVFAFADNESTKTVKVRGSYTVLSTSSALEWRQAPELARQDARRAALEKVSNTKVNIWDKVESSSSGETFNSLALNQLDGEIVEFIVLKEWTDKSDVRNTETVFYCEAKVTVKKGKEPDPDFVADITGLNPVYYDGDAITCKVKPYKDCYLKIFLFANANEGYRIYPNYIEDPFLLRANREVVFPTDNNWEYSVTKDTDAPFETNCLVFVFTKEERPFYNETTSRAEIEKWMALIPNDAKFLFFAPFDIRKK